MNENDLIIYITWHKRICFLLVIKEKIQCINILELNH